MRRCFAFTLLLAIVLAGCAAVELHRFASHAEQGDYPWIADRPVGCDRPSDTCAQLHLVKGDACLRLARSGQAPLRHYRCAVDALAAGLALKRSWPDPAVRQRMQEYLCESLAHLQSHQSGEAAEDTLARLTEAAETLYRLAPGSLPAVYYLSLARLRQAQPKLTDLAIYERMPVCSRLKRTLMAVLATMETASAKGSEDWQRLAKDYERLSFELGTAIAAAQCR